MAVYSPEQIAAVAGQAGITGDAQVTAVAVALAESSGRTDVVNSIGATGLWQILISAHPQYTTAQMKDPVQNARAMAAISNGGHDWQPWQAYTTGAYQKFLPQARKAVGSGGGVPVPKSNTGPLGVPPGGPWFAYALTGTIQRQSNPVLAESLVQAGWVGFATQSEAKAFIAQSPATSVKSAVKNPVDWLSNIGSFFTKLGEANTWLRIGEVVLGMALVIVGVAKLAEGTPAGKAALSIGTKAAML